MNPFLFLTKQSEIMVAYIITSLTLVHWNMLSYIGDTWVQMWKCGGHVHKVTCHEKRLRTAGSVDRALKQSQVRCGAGAIIYWFYGLARIT